MQVWIMTFYYLATNVVSILWLQRGHVVDIDYSVLQHTAVFIILNLDSRAGPSLIDFWRYRRLPHNWTSTPWGNGYTKNTFTTWSGVGRSLIDWIIRLCFPCEKYPRNTPRQKALPNVKWIAEKFKVRIKCPTETTALLEDIAPRPDGW